eukprot:GSMAST32.ASY1.ANO1.189.1 assembled CDS
MSDVRKRILGEINMLRKAASLKPVKLDETASTCATEHCEAMVKFNALSSWNMTGSRASERYRNCNGFVSENIGGNDEGVEIERIVEEDNALSPHVTHVGIGFATGKGRMRYSEVYLCQELVVNQIDENWYKDGTTVALQTMGDVFKPYGASLFYDSRADSTLTPSEARTLQIVGKEAALGKEIVSIPPWKIQSSDSDSCKWAFTLEFDESMLKPGVYTLVIYVADWKATQIPRSKPSDMETFTLPGDFGFIGNTIVLDHNKGRYSEPPITGLWVIKSEEDESVLPPPGTVTRVSGSNENFGVLVAFEKEIDQLPLLEVQLSSLEEANEGFELLPVSLAPNTVEEGHVNDVFISQRKGKAVAGDVVVTQVALAFGDILPGYDVILPVPIATGAHLLVRTQIWVPEIEATEAVGASTMKISAQKARDENVVEDETYIDPLQKKARQKPNIDRDLQRLEEENALLSGHALLTLKRRQLLNSNGGAAETTSSAMELERRYLKQLSIWCDSLKELDEIRDTFNRQAMELQARLDDKQGKATEISESFADFKREIAKAAENSRTGKTIPRKIIRQFELAEQRKDSEMEKVRITNIKYRMQLQKLGRDLKEKEQLAEGLHMIDFEQLKIENQTLNEKIEERIEEVLKFKSKISLSVQHLSHVKEKLQFVNAKKDQFLKENESLEGSVILEREKLTKFKKERDIIREKLIQKKSTGGGFSGSKSLIKDFSKRKHTIQLLEKEVAQLKEKYEILVR